MGLLQMTAIYIGCPVAVALIVGFITWMFKTYNRFSSIDNNVQLMVVSIEKVTARLDVHDTRITNHDLYFARLDGAGILPKK